jgi:hypothetical protein
MKMMWLTELSVGGGGAGGGGGATFPLLTLGGLNAGPTPWHPQRIVMIKKPRKGTRGIFFIII